MYCSCCRSLLLEGEDGEQVKTVAELLAQFRKDKMQQNNVNRDNTQILRTGLISPPLKKMSKQAEKKLFVSNICDNINTHGLLSNPRSTKTEINALSTKEDTSVAAIELQNNTASFISQLNRKQESPGMDSDCIVNGTTIRPFSTNTVRTIVPNNSERDDVAQQHEKLNHAVTFSGSLSCLEPRVKSEVSENFEYSSHKSHQNDSAQKPDNTLFRNQLSATLLNGNSPSKCMNNSGERNSVREKLSKLRSAQLIAGNSAPSPPAATGPQSDAALANSRGNLSFLNLISQHNEKVNGYQIKIEQIDNDSITDINLSTCAAAKLTLPMNGSTTFNADSTDFIVDGLSSRSLAIINGISNNNRRISGTSVELTRDRSQQVDPDQPASNTTGGSRHSSDDVFKLYQCKYCNKKFDRAFSCNRHERIHTGYKPCFCSQCGKGFSEPRNLRHHMIRFHSDGTLKHLIRRDRRRKHDEDASATATASNIISDMNAAINISANTMSNMNNTISDMTLNIAKGAISSISVPTSAQSVVSLLSAQQQQKGLSASDNNSAAAAAAAVATFNNVFRLAQQQTHLNNININNNVASLLFASNKSNGINVTHKTLQDVLGDLNIISNATISNTITNSPLSFMPGAANVIDLVARHENNQTQNSNSFNQDPVGLNIITTLANPNITALTSQHLTSANIINSSSLNAINNSNIGIKSNNSSPNLTVTVNTSPVVTSGLVTVNTSPVVAATVRSTTSHPINTSNNTISNASNDNCATNSNASNGSITCSNIIDSITLGNIGTRSVLESSTVASGACKNIDSDSINSNGIHKKNESDNSESINLNIKTHGMSEQALVVDQVKSVIRNSHCNNSTTAPTSACNSNIGECSY